MSRRPYFQSSNSELETLYERHKNDRGVLRELQRELHHRERPSAQALAERVQRRLAALKGPAKASSGSNGPRRPGHLGDDVGVSHQDHSDGPSQPKTLDGLPATPDQAELAEEACDVLGDGGEEAEHQVEALADLFEALTKAVAAPFEPRDAIRWVNTKTDFHIVAKRPLLVDVCKYLDRKGRARWDGRRLWRRGGVPPVPGPRSEIPGGSTALTMGLPPADNAAGSVGDAYTAATWALPRDGRTATTRDLPSAFLGRPRVDAARASLARLHVGQVLAGRFELLDLAGVGGMGEVWRARVLDPHAAVHEVAIKTVKTADERLDKALRREIALLRTLSRPEFFPVVHESFRIGDRQYVVMDWVDGVTLKSLVGDAEALRRLDHGTFLRIMSQIADRLAYLHSWPSGEVVFRDLKPTNVMLDPESHHLRLVDFGISHLVRSDGADRVRAGTHGYLAPEVLKGTATIKTDIYAMGRVALFLLFGDERFEQRGRSSTPPLGYERGLPPSVVQACLRICDERPERRPPDALEALSLLRTALSERREGQPSSVLLRVYGCQRCHRKMLRDSYFCVHCGGSRKDIAAPRNGPTVEHLIEFHEAPRFELDESRAAVRRRTAIYTDLMETRAATDLTTLQCLPHIQVQPYDYQREAAVHVLSRMHGRAMIADDVGLGKTIEAGLIVREYLDRGLARNCLLVAPPGLLLTQLREEMNEKFGLKFVEYRGTGDRDQEVDRVGPWSVAQHDLVAVSMATLRREKNLQAVGRRDWDILVVDECHHIKNRTTKTYKAIRSIVTPYVLFMSATPFSGKTDELWTVYSALKPGSLGASITLFNRDFLGATGRPSKALRELVRELTIRRRRQDLAVAFPGRTAVRVGVRMTEAEADLYRAAAAAICDKSANSFQMTMHLRQLSSSFESLAASKIARDFPGELQGALSAATDEEHPKARALLKRIVPRLPDGEKVLVFSTFRDSQRALARMLNEAGFPALKLIDTASSRRPAVIRRFRDDPSIRALVCGEGAGEGLNLQFCSVLVNYDLPWNPMRIEQRIGRVQRLGQKRRKVTVVNLAMAETIEDRILLILTEKLRMFELLMGQTEQILGQLLTEEGASFERWIAHALRPDGGVNERVMKAREKEMESAVRRADRESRQLGRLTDDLVGVSGPTGEEAGMTEPAIPELDLSYLEGDWELDLSYLEGDW